MFILPKYGRWNMDGKNNKEMNRSNISLEMSRCSSMCGGIHLNTIASETTANPEQSAAEAQAVSISNGNRTSASNLNPLHKPSSVPVKLGCTFPPSGPLGRNLTRGISALVIWAALWSTIGEDLLPGGNLFSIYIVVVFATLGGLLVESIPRLTLPALLGQLIVGLILRNVPGIDVAKTINKKWSSTLRSIALAVILVRSGLGLNTTALRKLKFTVIRLAFGPAIAETITTAVLVHFLLGVRWLWAFQLGFVLAAVSLAVVIPCLLDLQTEGYGVKEGIPTLVMAAASFDNVLSISGFGVCLGMAFSSGSLVFNVFRAPLEVAIGIVGGVLLGLLCWILPNKDEPDVSRGRFVILLSCSLLSLFGCKVAGFSGAGALGVVTMATVAAYRWGSGGKSPIARAVAIIWCFFEPLLFGLVGAEVDVKYLESSLVGKGIGALIVSLVVRTLVTYLMVCGTSLALKERLFIAIAWLPKATVQAAIGSVALDTARENGLAAGSFQEIHGIQILTLAVLAILVTSPIGAIGIVLAGPRMLNQSPAEEVELEPMEAENQPNADHSTTGCWKLCSNH